MKYINKKTNMVISTDCKIKGDNWEKISNEKPVKPRAPKKPKKDDA